MKADELLQLSGSITMNEFHKLVEVIAIKPFEHAEAEWRRGLELLCLPLFYQPALAIALAESNWQEARDVARYLRTVTIRQAARLGLADADGPPPVSEILTGERTHEEVVNAEDPGIEWGDNIYSELDPDIIDEDGKGVNWERVAQRAGLEEDELCVLECRAAGMTRSQILEELADDEEDRLRLQAAYRRLHDRRAKIKDILLGRPLQKRELQVHRN